MKIRTILASLVVASCTLSGAHAAVIVSVISTPLGGGLIAHTLNLQSDLPMRGFAIEAIAPGGMNHENAGGALDTIFQDSNNIIPLIGGDPALDSQFLFHTENDFLVVAPNTQDNPENLLEDGNRIKAGFGNTNFRLFNRDVLRIVTPEPAGVVGNLAEPIFTLVNSTASQFDENTGNETLADISGSYDGQNFTPIPEPASLAMLLKKFQRRQISIFKEN